MRREEDIIHSDDSMRMYAALDVHRAYSQIAVEEEDGFLLREERVESDPDLIAATYDSTSTVGKGIIIFIPLSLWVLTFSRISSFSLHAKMNK